MRKLTFLLACLFLVGIGLVNAQSKSISGKVISSDDGQPVIGATVKVKGTNLGTITGVSGSFKISVPDNGKKFVVSYMGMLTQEVDVSNNAVIKLQPDTKQISEVVVTAMGLKRSEKSLGYAASTVKADDLARTSPVTVTSGLTGKVAGLNISGGGGTGASEKVIVRAVTSFFGTNNPLYVIDGIPINNSFMGTGATNQAVDFGNQAGDINPEDVESVTVLKGASATALYGSRAAAGIIMITTKRAKANSKLKISYNGSVNVSNVLRVPQMENMFGQGWPLLNQAGTPEPGLGENGSWGPALDGLIRKWGAPLDNNGLYSATGTQRTKPFASVDNNLRNFYENGLEVNNGVTASIGNANTSFIVSYGNVSSNGVLPSNVDKYSRNTFSVRGDANYDKIHLSFDVNYVRKDIRNVRAGQGGATGATTFQDVIQTPVDVNYQDLKDYNNPYNNLDNFYTGYAQNPYWIIANNQSVYQDDRTYGKLELSYDIIKGLKAVGRLGGDFTNSRTKAWAAQVAQSPTGWANQFSSKSLPGNYDEFNRSFSQIDATTMLNADYELSPEFRVTGSLGWNFNKISDYQTDAYQESLDVPEWYNLLNGVNNPVVTSYQGNKKLIAAFFQGDVSYKDWAFLGFSARNDFSSSLPKGKNSYFYGGVNGSLILTDAIPTLKSDAINKIKVRASVGQTGKDAPLYYTFDKMVPTQVSLGFGSLYLPLNGFSGLSISNQLANKDLKPEITTESEVGLEGMFLGNRVGFDAAYYDRETKDQIIPSNVAPEIGYTTFIRNIGAINNKGIELRVFGTPVKTKDFEWEVGVTYTKNWSKIEKLWDNVKSYLYTSAYDVYYYMNVGDPVGVFQVPKILTVADTKSPYYGKVIVNSSGLPQISSTENTTIGNSAPDFAMGLNTSFKYKNLTLSAVFDYRQGGYFYSNTARMLDWNGNGTNTMFNGRQPFLVPNSVKEVSPGVYADNDIPLMTTGGVLSYWNYSSGNKGMESNSVLPRTYVKLRELSLSYNLPKRLLAKTFISELQVSLIGRNLLMWTPVKNNFVDPDQTNYGNDLLSGFGEFSSAPTVRTMGASLKLSF